jgi:hypothetical protein
LRFFHSSLPQLFFLLKLLLLLSSPIQVFMFRSNPFLPNWWVLQQISFQFLPHWWQFINNPNPIHREGLWFSVFLTLAQRSSYQLLPLYAIWIWADMTA